MTAQEANKLRLVNRLTNVLAETEATLKVSYLKRMIKAYESGTITATEFIKEAKK